MTIGRIPKVDPGNTQPRDRKPPAPAGRAGFKTAAPAKDRVPPTPSQPSPGFAPKSKGTPPKPMASTPKSSTGSAPTSAGKSGPVQAPSVAPQDGPQGAAKAFWQQQEQASRGSAKPAPQADRNAPPQQAKTPAGSSKPAPQADKKPSQPRAPTSSSPASPTARTTEGWEKTAKGWVRSNSSPAPEKQPATRQTAFREPVLQSAPVNAELFQFLQSQSTWYANGVVALDSTILPILTADHVKLFPHDTKHIILHSLSVTPEAMRAMNDTPNLRIENLWMHRISDFVQSDGSVLLPESLRELRIREALPAMQQLLTTAGKLPNLQKFAAHYAGIDDADVNTLVRSSSLTHVDLQGNHVTAKGAHALFGISALEVMDLSDNKIGIDGSPQLSVHHVPSTSRLSVLDVSNNQHLSEASLHALYRFALTSVNFSGTNITRFPADNSNRWKGMNTLWLGNNRLNLANEDTLNMLRLVSATKLTDISMPAAGLGFYVASIAKIPTLRSLDVSFTDLPTGQLRAAAREHLPSFLKLTQCNLTSAHIDELMESPDGNSGLQALWIERNPELGALDYARLLDKYPGMMLGIGTDDHADACFAQLSDDHQARVIRETLNQRFPLEST